MGEHTHNAWLRAQCIQHLWSVFGSWSLKRSNCDLLVDIPKNLGLDILLLPVSLLLLSSDLLGQHWLPSFLSWLTTIHQILQISIVVVVVSKTLVIINIMQWSMVINTIFTWQVDLKTWLSVVWLCLLAKEKHR